MDGFIDWFKTNKVDVICNSMLRSIREECGLGNPPDIFTTNPSESINALLKHKTDYRKSELPKFVEKIKELSQEQTREVEHAVVNRGKYRLRPEYKHLEIPESKWFTMSIEQRRSHLTKVHSMTVMSLGGPETPATSNVQIGATKSQLTVSVESAAKSLNVPLTCLESIWRKAMELISDSNAIAPAPGQTEGSRMVLSYSGKTPHLVTSLKGGGFTCDANCPNWKSIAFCSHSVAVAEINEKLPQFIRKKKKSNTTSYFQHATWSWSQRWYSSKAAEASPSSSYTSANECRLP